MYFDKLFGPDKSRWANASKTVLNNAARRIIENGADPYAFSGGAAHFWAFAQEADRAALRDMTGPEAAALLGCDDAEQVMLSASIAYWQAHEK